MIANMVKAQVSDNVTTTGERIRREREAKDWQQADLARILGVTEATISRYETGERRVTPELLARLADLFAVSADHLLGRERDQADWEEEVRAMRRSMSGLSEAERQDILDYMRWRKEQSRKRGRANGDPAAGPGRGSADGGT
jgi:transcriptional regulator with XRE-family HTH domain